MNAAIPAPRRVLPAAAALALAAGAALAQSDTTGPDVIVGEVWDIAINGVSGATTAYSVGTDSCNIGTQGVTWIANNNQHPVITSNLFRLKTVAGSGRFEQLGMSWCKHGFLATNQSYCGPCGTPSGAVLGPGGCSDIYDSGLNGQQSNLGPRSEVNATTGAFPYPYVLQGTGGVIGKRCQVPTADIDPAQNSGALYFADSHYVVPDDARYPAAGAINGLNNVSYRRILISGTTANPSFAALTHQQSPGIQAWKDTDPAVTLVNAEYNDTSIAGVTIVARFIIGAKATDLGGGIYHYEYAVYNVNADRSGGSFSVPLGGATPTNIGFRAPLYHSGEPYDNTPWPSALTGGNLRWASAAFTPAANANALRWATMYTFRFDAASAPITGSVTLGLFKAGTPTSITAAGIPVPGGVPVICYANCDNSVTPPVLNVGDFTCFLQKVAAGCP